MTTNIKSYSHRRTTNTGSNPRFLQVALSPYRRDDPERNIVINTWTIQKVCPPLQIRRTNLDTGAIKVHVPDPRYTVIFKVGRERESGRATRAGLEAVGIQIPPGWS